VTSPRVSIVTATFNSLPGLQATVASVAAQTSDDYEHIVVDGGSSDGTQDWLVRADPSIRWISEPDDGIADAMNKGVKKASGEWILFLHAEDTFATEWSLEEALPALDTEADVVSYDVQVFERDLLRVFKSRGFCWHINFKTIPHQGVFSRRGLFDKLGTFDTNLAISMDYDFFLRAHRQGARVDVTNTILSRMPATGVSSMLDWASLKERFREERIVQLRHVLGPAHRFMYSMYWPVYLSYRRIRSLVGAVTR
jgi:glycosyltransferase involved in cell wall biosynthesis